MEMRGIQTGVNLKNRTVKGWRKGIDSELRPAQGLTTETSDQR